MKNKKPKTKLYPNYEGTGVDWAVVENPLESQLSKVERITEPTTYHWEVIDFSKFEGVKYDKTKHGNLEYHPDFLKDQIS